MSSVLLLLSPRSPAGPDAETPPEPRGVGLGSTPSKVGGIGLAQGLGAIANGCKELLVAWRGAGRGVRREATVARRHWLEPREAEAGK